MQSIADAGAEHEYRMYSNNAEYRKRSNFLFEAKAWNCTGCCVYVLVAVGLRVLICFIIERFHRKRTTRSDVSFSLVRATDRRRNCNFNRRRGKSETETFSPSSITRESGLSSSCPSWKIRELCGLFKREKFNDRSCGVSQKPGAKVEFYWNIHKLISARKTFRLQSLFLSL